MKRFQWFMLAVSALSIVNFILLLNGLFNTAYSRKLAEGNRELVREFGITDLSLWTEARYTRHPSQTDFFSPFQDLPGGMEHFPAGSIIAVPVHLSGPERGFSEGGRGQ